MDILSAVLVLAVLAAANCSHRNKTSAVLDEVPLVVGVSHLAVNLYYLLHNRLEHFDFDSDLRQDVEWSCPYCRTDLPRLRKGKVGALFWNAWVNCDSQFTDAVQRTMEQIDVIQRLIEKYPNDLQFVESASGIEDEFANKRIASLLGVAGGHSIDSRLALLRGLRNQGVRYMALTHDCDTPWAGAAGSEAGLTDFGRDVVVEMNRLGMMVDLAHASYQTRMDALDKSLAPVIFSHTAAAALCNHSANVPDDILDRMRGNGGIVMVSFTQKYLRCDGANATLDDVVAHINHIREKAGVDHVGIGGNFDGSKAYATGLEDVSTFPKLFDRLADSKPGEQHWTQEDLKKLAGLNLLGVMRRVEEVRDRMGKLGAVEKRMREEDLPEERRARRTEDSQESRAATMMGEYSHPE